LHFMDGIVCLWCQKNGTSITVANVVDEIDYFRRRHWLEYVALGPDYPPQRSTWVEGVSNTTQMRNLVIEMMVRNYTDPEIEEVLGLNLLDLYSRVWTMSGSSAECRRSVAPDPSTTSGTVAKQPSE
jgi:microsomal dipeptidase-like Zn-dependent dipeptidase